MAINTTPAAGFACVALVCSTYRTNAALGSLRHRALRRSHRGLGRLRSRLRSPKNDDLLSESLLHSTKKIIYYQATAYDRVVSILQKKKGSFDASNNIT